MAVLRIGAMLLVAAAAFGQGSISEGEELLELGRYSEAVREFEKVLEVEPRNSRAHYRLGEVLSFEKDLQGAEREFRACLDGDGKPAGISAWANVRIGMILDLTLQRERAIEHYESAIRVPDASPPATAAAERYLRDGYRPGSRSLRPLTLR
jgi:tetratricopeptide (TPR) repeat protein